MKPWARNAWIVAAFGMSMLLFLGFFHLRQGGQGWAMLLAGSIVGVFVPIAISGTHRPRSARANRRVQVEAGEVVLRHQWGTHFAFLVSALACVVGAVVALIAVANPVYRSLALLVAPVAPFLAWSYLLSLLRRPCTVLSPAGVRVRGDIFDAELGWDELVAVRVEESPAGVRVVGVPGASSYLWRRVRGVVPLYGRPGEGSIFLYDFTYDRPGVVAEVMETLARLAPERRAEYLLGPAVALLRGDHETIQES